MSLPISEATFGQLIDSVYDRWTQRLNDVQRLRSAMEVALSLTKRSATAEEALADVVALLERALAYEPEA